MGRRPGADPERHLDVTPLPTPADGDGPDDPALRSAVDLLLHRLPPDRPLWRARVLRSGAGLATHLVIVMHHALADGMGGLAVLAALVDGSAPGPAVAAGARPMPAARELARDAWAERVQGLTAAPDHARRLVSGLRELGAGPPRLAGRTGLLAPTSDRRRADVAEVDLDRVVAAARACGVTVNDVVVVAVARALQRLLARRGDPLRELVVSVPVSARGSTTVAELGNRVGVLPVTVPLAADRRAQLQAVTIQRARLGVGATRGSSGVALAAGFRMLAAVGLFEPFVNRQRLVHTFLTNLRGPTEPIRLAGARVTRVVPLATTPGNVTVSFDVLSVAGRLVVTVMSDPTRLPEHALLRDALQAELDGLDEPGG